MGQKIAMKLKDMVLRQRDRLPSFEDGLQNLDAADDLLPVARGEGAAAGVLQQTRDLFVAEPRAFDPGRSADAFHTGGEALRWDCVHRPPDLREGVDLRDQREDLRRRASSPRLLLRGEVGPEADLFGPGPDEDRFSERSGLLRQTLAPEPRMTSGLGGVLGCLKGKPIPGVSGQLRSLNAVFVLGKSPLLLVQSFSCVLKAAAVVSARSCSLRGGSPLSSVDLSACAGRSLSESLAAGEALIEMPGEGDGGAVMNRAVPSHGGFHPPLDHRADEVRRERGLPPAFLGDSAGGEEDEGRASIMRAQMIQRGSREESVSSPHTVSGARNCPCSLSMVPWQDIWSAKKGLYWGGQFIEESAFLDHETQTIDVLGDFEDARLLQFEV